ncbi:hypothetical protein J2Y69_002357 [Microbacterium resistens]|uniref:Uncharacterized protein n=1 Tax=Microbacterium resistens TaxID=156977 RepID=A0ABU1SDR4_9MICO|nr:hypothetical protein [Microbacterium resistens]MDR6867749.1 hypothetical protein [Microbacterium resistens]
MPNQTSASAAERGDRADETPLITIDPDFHFPAQRERGSFLRALRQLFPRTP